MREFKLPDPGEGLTEADVVTWRVAVGDVVAVNDIVVEIETAKSLVELPIPYAGTVSALLVNEGDTVEVGAPIIVIDDGSGAAAGGSATDATATTTEGSAPSEAAAGGQAGSGEAGGPVAVAAEEPKASGAAESKPGGAAEPKAERTAVLVGYGVKQTEAKRRPRRKQNLLQTIAHYPDEEPAVKESVHADASSGVGELVAAHSTHVLRDQRPLSELAQHSRADLERAWVLAKPMVRKLAKDLGVDLVTVEATGDGGTITRDDVLAARDSARGLAPADAGGAGSSGPGSASGDAALVGGARHTAAVSAPAWPGDRGEERTPIKGVRKATAAAMVSSAFTAPHVTEWVEVDVTATMDLVDRLKKDKEFAGVKVTPLLVLAKAMCVAVRRNPGVNATWDEAAQEIVLKRYVNRGIAAATPRGLLVPNVKDADLMSMAQLAGAIGELTETARQGKMQPADMSGGTITITNIGVFGIDAGTPILNRGESAILAFGTITRKPWVVGKGDDERIEPRWVTTLALSFDHRLVDGELGSRYLADVAAILHDPAKGLVWG